MKINKLKILAASALIFASVQSHANTYTLSNYTVASGSTVSNFGDTYNIYGYYRNYGTINNNGPVTFTSDSIFTGYAGSTSINNNAVTNNGSMIFSEGSVVSGRGSYTQTAGGKLVVNGTFTQEGGIYITGSGYLGGSGTINGNVYASGSDVIIAPGNSPGHLTINGDLKLEDGAKLVMQVYSLENFDKISVTGNFDLGAARILFDVAPDLKGTFLEKFNFSNFFEKIETSGAAHVADASLFGKITFEYGDANSLPGNPDNLIKINDLVSAVPEPETYAMMLAGLGLMGFVARRRKAKQA